jgi:AcrR family transcriptional regulator
MSAEARPRGRPRLFDEETALDRITELFWRKGYADTSLADLVEASGVHKPSLYRTFGTKEQLFARVARRYLARRMEMIATLVESSGPGIDGIHTFLSLMRDDIVSGTSQHGCLLVATSTELCGTTPSWENFGREYRDAVRDLMRPLAAKADGDSDTTHQRAELLTTWFLGIDITTRGAATTTEIDRSIDALHATIETWQDNP